MTTSDTTDTSGLSGDAGPDPISRDVTAGSETLRKLAKRIALATLACGLLLIGCAVGLVYERQAAYNRNVERIPAALPTNVPRPSPASPRGTENWLLVGSESRLHWDSASGDVRSAAASLPTEPADALMLLHLPADHKKAYIISFPRDALVSVPHRRGAMKMSSVITTGGPPLLVETVESLTDIRIDHFAALDFEGFKSMTDALGGVKVSLPRPVVDTRTGRTWNAGENKLDGVQALEFIRQSSDRKSYVDADAIKRQQELMQALAAKATGSGMITNPFKLNSFLMAFTKSVSVDESVSGGKLRSMVLSMRGLRSGDMVFLSVPSTTVRKKTGTRVTTLDRTRADALYSAIRSGDVAGYVP